MAPGDTVVVVAKPSLGDQTRCSHEGKQVNQEQTAHLWGIVLAGGDEGTAHGSHTGP